MVAVHAGRLGGCLRLGNVSGTQLDTHRDTLLMAGGGSYFALMLSDAYQHALDHEGRYFIDRDPRLFGLILQFLRGSLQANPNPNPNPDPNPAPNLALTLTSARASSRRRARSCWPRPTSSSASGSSTG